MRFMFQNTQLPSSPVLTFHPAANFWECEMLDLASRSLRRGYDGGINPRSVHFPFHESLFVLYLSVLRQNGYSRCSHKTSAVEGVRGPGLKSRRGMASVSNLKISLFCSNWNGITIFPFPWFFHLRPGPFQIIFPD